MNTRSLPSSSSLIAMLLSICAMIVVGGCSTPAPSSLDDPDTLRAETPISDRPFVLYRLDGDAGQQEDAPQGETLQGWRILQECPITDEQTRHDLFRALDDAIASAPGAGSRCFIPRHAIRVQTDGVVVDYIICFQCGRYRLYEGSTPVTGGGISSSPKAVFDRILSQCN